MEEIDNTLVKTEEGYTNAQNSYEVLITDNEESRGEVIFKEDGYEISWQMMETGKEEETLDKFHILVPNTVIEQEEIPETPSTSPAVVESMATPM